MVLPARDPLSCRPCRCRAPASNLQTQGLPMTALQPLQSASSAVTRLRKSPTSNSIRSRRQSVMICTCPASAKKPSTRLPLRQTCPRLSSVVTDHDHPRFILDLPFPQRQAVLLPCRADSSTPPVTTTRSCFPACGKRQNRPFHRTQAWHHSKRQRCTLPHPSDRPGWHAHQVKRSV